MTASLEGRRILVTGAARGIGRASALRFAEAGAMVGCLDMDGAALDELCAGPEGNRLHRLVGDVTSSDTLARAMDELAQRFGGLDGVVNSAGVDLEKPLTDVSDADWDRVLRVNLTGPMIVCRAALPLLKAAGRATIVNVSSGAGLQPLKFRTAYSASKAGLQMFSKALAMETAEFGVRVNAVCPGAVETDLFRSGLGEPEDAEGRRVVIRQRYALGRIAAAEEIAAAIFWLTSWESSYVTGSVLAVDGGRTFH